MNFEYVIAFFSLGPPELIVIGVVGLLVFGSRLPEVGRSLGRGVVEFKKGLKGIQDEIDKVDEEDETSDSMKHQDEPKKSSGDNADEPRGD